DHDEETAENARKEPSHWVTDSSMVNKTSTLIFMGTSWREIDERVLGEGRSAAPGHHGDAERSVEDMFRPRLETMACEHRFGRATCDDLGEPQPPAGQPHMRGG